MNSFWWQQYNLRKWEATLHAHFDGMTMPFDLTFPWILWERGWRVIGMMGRWEEIARHVIAALLYPRGARLRTECNNSQPFDTGTPIMSVVPSCIRGFGFISRTEPFPEYLCPKVIKNGIFIMGCYELGGKGPAHARWCEQAFAHATRSSLVSPQSTTNTWKLHWLKNSKNLMLLPCLILAIFSLHGVAIHWRAWDGLLSVRAKRKHPFRLICWYLIMIGSQMHWSIRSTYQLCAALKVSYLGQWFRGRSGLMLKRLSYPEGFKFCTAQKSVTSI